MKNPVSAIMSATPEYGIGVTKNRFALIDLEEEVDPLELLERKEKEKEEKKKAKLVEKEIKSKQPAVAAKPKAPKILKETQKKAVNEAPKIKEEKERRIPKKEVNFAENRNGNNRDQGKENWFENDSAPRNDGEGEDRRNFRSSDSGDGFQRGGRGTRRGGAAGGGGFQRGVFVRGGGRGGGGGGGRGGFQQRSTFDARGKREYDRHSGSDKTGVKAIDKREGSGAHNWGNPQDDWNNTMREDEWTTPQEDEWATPVQTNEADKPEPTEASEAPPEDSAPNTTAETVEGPKTEAATDAEEAEKREMTLDEWKAMKGQREMPKYNVRKPGEGEDLTQWKKMFVLEKRKEDEEDDEDEEYEMGLYPQRVGRQRRIYDINIKFKDTRGNVDMTRNRGRGGRGRGGGPFRPRNPSPSHHFQQNKEPIAPAPKVDDEKDFPSLF